MLLVLDDDKLLVLELDDELCEVPLEVELLGLLVLDELELERLLDDELDVLDELDSELVLVLDSDDVLVLESDELLELLDSSSRAMMVKPCELLGKLAALPPVVKFRIAGLPATPAVYFLSVAWKLPGSGIDSVISVSVLLGVSEWMSVGGTVAKSYTLNSTRLYLVEAGPI